MLKGVIFDLDGVLVDTEYFQWQGWVEILKPYEISLPKQKYFKYAGKRGDIVELELIRDFNLNLDKGSLLIPKEKMVKKWVKSRKLKRMAYARETVDFFLNRGIKVAVAGGAPRDEVLIKLKRTNLYTFFKAIVSGSDVEKGKPNPDIYLLTIKKIGLNPENCLALEDTQYGLEAAKSAGLFCLVIPNEYSEKQDFSRADGIFPNLREAVNWIKEKHNLIK